MKSFTYTKAYTKGLIAFGVNGATNHFASRADVQAALKEAEANRGWAVCAGMIVHRDNLQILLNELGPA